MKTSKFRVTGLCEGNSPVTGEFPTQRASNAKNVSIWWRHQASSGPCNKSAMGKDDREISNICYWRKTVWNDGVELRMYVKHYFYGLYLGQFGRW